VIDLSTMYSILDIEIESDEINLAVTSMGWPIRSLRRNDARLARWRRWSRISTRRAD